MLLLKNHLMHEYNLFYYDIQGSTFELEKFTKTVMYIWTLGLCIVESPVLDSYACESFDINREDACVFCSPGFYQRNTTSLRKKEEMAMLRIKVCMNIIFIRSRSSGALMVEVWICTTMALQNLQQYGCQTGNKFKKNHVT